MIVRPVLILFFCICSVFCIAQHDSLVYNENTILKEGLYLNYADFRKNDPVTRDQIETRLNKDQLDFFGKIIDEPKITFARGGNSQTIEPVNLWGFYQNHALFVNYKGVFYRVPVFGAICYLVAIVEVPTYYPGYYGPGYGGMIGTTAKTKEVREFIINFYDGMVEELNLERVEKLLSRDETLYKEFTALKRKKRKAQISRFIKRYNEQHPVYFFKQS